MEIMPILAGLGLFLYGMLTMEEALRGLAGRTFKKIMQRYTNNPFLAILAGVVITILVQSSSMISLLIMSFVGAGIIGLRNGIGVILGANIGTTGTSWIITFIGFKVDLGVWVLPLLAVGGIATLFSKNERIMQASKTLMGFSFVFLGLTYMKNGFADFAAQIDIGLLHDRNPMLFVLIGLLLTAVIQASSATMMILMSSLAAGLVTLHDGFYVVIGSDIGTTMTAVIGTLNGSSVRKKVGWAHVLFNIFNAIVVLPFVWAFEYFILQIMAVESPYLALAIFHTLFNIVGVLAMLPLMKQFTWLVDKIIRTKEHKIATHIMLAEPKETHSAMTALEKECYAFVQHAMQTNGIVFHLKTSNGGNFITAYPQLKEYETEIVAFYMKLQQGILSADEAQRLNHLANAVRNATLSAKNLKDIKHNFDELKSTATDNLYALYQKINDCQQLLYKEIENFITVTSQEKGKDVPAEHERLKTLQKQFYKDQITYVQQLFADAHPTEMDLPTLQNMLHDLSSSNESLLRALKNLMVKDRED